MPENDNQNFFSRLLYRFDSWWSARIAERLRRRRRRTRKSAISAPNCFIHSLHVSQDGEHLVGLPSGWLEALTAIMTSDDLHSNSNPDAVMRAIRSITTPYQNDEVKNNIEPANNVTLSSDSGCDVSLSEKVMRSAVSAVSYSSGGLPTSSTNSSIRFPTSKASTVEKMKDNVEEEELSPQQCEFTDRKKLLAQLNRLDTIDFARHVQLRNKEKQRDNILPPSERKSDEMVIAQLKELVVDGDPLAKYELLEEIGEGSSCVVQKAVLKGTGELVAIKKIQVQKQDQQKKLLVTELQALKKCRHDNLVRFIEAYLVNDATKPLKGTLELWVVTEYLDGGVLTKLVQETEPDEIRIATMMYEILKAINYLHKNNIVHRDIKSDNVLLGRDGKVLLIDLGFCAHMSSYLRRRTVAGTMYWMAPEMAKITPYNYKIDIWSLGIIGLEMIDGEPPYLYRNLAEAQSLIANYGCPDFRWRPDISPLFKGFLDRCLVMDPDLRADTDELLEHPFVKLADSTDILIPYIDAALKCT